MIKRTANRDRKAGISEGKHMEKPAIKPQESTQVFYQFPEGEWTEQGLITKVKEHWQEQGHNLEEIQKLNLYVKPEDKKIYYLINEQSSGEVTLN